MGDCSSIRNVASLDDRTVVGETLNRDGNLPDAFSAALYLAYKYATDFSAGILANAYGDSCHRGAIVGAILAAENSHWILGLQKIEPVNRCSYVQRIYKMIISSVLIKGQL